MSNLGYYRFPTIHDDRVVFCCEDDLWTVPVEGGVARRLSANQGEASRPLLSPCGKWVAFSGCEEGETEIYVMPSEGGALRRLTFLGGLICHVVAWHPTTGEIIFASSAGRPFRGMLRLLTVPVDGGLPCELPYGRANAIAFGPHGQSVTGRCTTRAPQHWKRYRGGTCGHLWVDGDGSGTFHRLHALQGNIASPMWIGERIYFLSDHEDIANLYSCTPQGEDVQRHSDHDEFYACNATTDGSRIVWHAGGELFAYDTQDQRTQPIPVTVQSPQTQRTRKFVPAGKYLDSFHPVGDGSSLALVSRGKVFVAGDWHGPVRQLGEADGVRYRIARWLRDDKTVVAVNDAGGDESLCVFHADGRTTQVAAGEIGRVIDLSVSPTDNRVALHNHRGELLVVDLDNGSLQILDRSHHGRIAGFSWSPDGRWIAYGMPTSPTASIIKLCELATGATHAVTRPVLRDMAPAFDPDGRYLYFLSHRVFDPIYDNLQFELSFPRGMRPYLITLQQDTPSPFVGQPIAFPDDKQNVKSDDVVNPIQIDIAGIEDRIVQFPVKEGEFSQICGVTGGKVFFTSHPVEGSLQRNTRDRSLPSNGTLHRYDLEQRKQETWAKDIVSFEVASDGKRLLYQSKQRLRLVDVGKKPKQDSERGKAGRDSGWLNLDRFKVSTSTSHEWRQMYHEAWRLMRDQFWREDMSGIDWERIRAQYEPLLERVASRSEFDDLLWEMQGELGTSHAYALGGDARQAAQYRQGQLGADLEYDEQHDTYRVKHVVQGDSWDTQCASPLQGPGINARPGDELKSVNGRPLSRHVTPEQLLVNLANAEVELTFARAGQPDRTVVVKTLDNEQPARYREWVDHNRNHVHAATSGRIGYVHIPNMMGEGFAEFHRYWLLESERDGLIVDVRFNGGGHVSQLLLEKLMRRRWGYCVARWDKPRAHPSGSMSGPMVALTNELAGSDGDIFSHCFKLGGLGPLIGKRTWGGTIGIHPRHPLVDGGLTTQPEFAFWFEDVGWAVENYGTDPNIDVDSPPHEEAAGRDVQLDRTIEEANRLLSSTVAMEPPRQ